jgi:hypothetical protein
MDLKIKNNPFDALWLAGEQQLHQTHNCLGNTCPRRLDDHHQGTLGALAAILSLRWEPIIETN